MTMYEQVIATLNYKAFLAPCIMVLCIFLAVAAGWIIDILMRKDSFIFGNWLKGASANEKCKFYGLFFLGLFIMVGVIVGGVFS